LKTTPTPHPRGSKLADKVLEPAAAAMQRTPHPAPRFKTVLVPSCGWPTEASVPTTRKRITKR
jgi:hypothetical protein